MGGAAEPRLHGVPEGRRPQGRSIDIPRGGIYTAREFPGKARPFPGLKADELVAMEGAIAALKAAGAEVVDPAGLPSMTATARADNLTSHPICEGPPAGPASESSAPTCCSTR